jgi:hypothetical protein
MIKKDALQNFRNRTFGIAPKGNIHTIYDAADFVKKRGFVYFWPIKGITLPSLWTAVAGDRRVADAHDDPGHITWQWKDNALGKKIWYYGKILRKKATMIDLEIAPYFYALSDNYGDPVEDVRIQYNEGKLTQEAKIIFESLHDNGPQDTISIRRITRMTSRESNSRFDRALTLLQSDFKILPIGVSDAGAWRYAFIYDLTHHHYPDIVEKARFISEQEARQRLSERYFDSVGAAKLSDLMKLFGWKKSDSEKTVRTLVETGIVIPNLEMESENGQWFALPFLA